MDGGPRQRSGRLRHHTMLHDRTDRLACSARKRNQRQRPRRKRQRLQGREYCNRSFGSQQALDQHLNSPAHVFECDECDRSFGSQQSLDLTSQCFGRLTLLTSCFLFWIISDPMDHKYSDDYVNCANKEANPTCLFTMESKKNC